MIKMVFWLAGNSDGKTRYINDMPDSVHVINTSEIARYRDDVRVTDISWIKQKERRNGEWLDRVLNVVRTGEEVTYVIRNLHDIYNAIDEDERDRYAPETIRELGVDRVRAEIMHASEAKRHQFLRSLDVIPEPIVMFYNVYPKTMGSSTRGFYMIVGKLVDEIEITWLDND